MGEEQKRKLRETNIAKHGSEENWKKFQSEAGAKGGATKTDKPKGFAFFKQNDPEKLHKLSIKGGKIGKRNGNKLSSTRVKSEADTKRAE